MGLPRITTHTDVIGPASTAAGKRLPLLLVGVLLLACPLTLSAGELHVVSWNVENLFDTEDDPETDGDEEFTPAGAMQYTPERLKIHLANLAQVLKKMNGEKGPDILGLGEVENLAVVKMLVQELKGLGRDYRIVHKDSPSDRGIDCAIVYDAKKVTLLSCEFLFVDADNTRDIVGLKCESNKHVLYVFMNHWPSRSNKEVQRITAAKTLRARLDEILTVDPGADVVVMGDLNDFPSDVSVKDHLRTSVDPMKLAKGEFFNTMGPIVDAKKGTYVFKNEWEVIDHIIVSPGLLDKQGLRWREGSTSPVMFDFQIFTPANPKMIPRPNRLYTGDAFHKTGISDHLPVECMLEVDD